MIIEGNGFLARGVILFFFFFLDAVCYVEGEADFSIAFGDH